MANKNKNLNSAARAKKDEFYTQRGDIENELRHYRNHFAGKTVFCNCDDPFESQFFFYFAVNFNFLKLKRLIVTSYRGSPVQGNLFNPVNDDRKPVYKVEINRIDKNPFDFDDVAEMLNELKAALDENSSATIDGNTLALLDGDGDFRSKECVALLKQADIVVTNPPFSLFRQFVKQLIDFDKKFLIVGNVNCITYKEIFPLIMQNKIWLGYGFKGMVGFFTSPYEDFASASEHRDGMIRNSGVHWFTNLEHEKRNRPIDLVCSYEETPEKFPRYDNYDAIEVSKTLDIPEDYFGVMGVPITFLDKYCPAQFEILGITDRQNTSGLRTKKYTATDDPNYNDLNARSVLKIGDEYKPTYARILIRRRQNGN
ncbi:MAG: adenine-specific methyltransferase EcoRI family protein [Selenomonadaceae bacterium]|nr:adenine-specific methyltransferase EcoRI family protein [Selenomonadaceae bacterium]MBR4382641.1 adenine-specific methyltransferase EcoRI family protein [Selenomonadaceae bacterium]